MDAVPTLSVFPLKSLALTSRALSFSIRFVFICKKGCTVSVYNEQPSFLFQARHQSISCGKKRGKGRRDKNPNIRRALESSIGCLLLELPEAVELSSWGRDSVRGVAPRLSDAQAAPKGGSAHFFDRKILRQDEEVTFLGDRGNCEPFLSEWGGILQPAGQMIKFDHLIR